VEAKTGIALIDLIAVAEAKPGIALIELIAVAARLGSKLAGLTFSGRWIGAAIPPVEAGLIRAASFAVLKQPAQAGPNRTASLAVLTLRTRVMF
jgi:hypothetical protein